MTEQPGRPSRPVKPEPPKAQPSVRTDRIERNPRSQEEANTVLASGRRPGTHLGEGEVFIEAGMLLYECRWCFALLRRERVEAHGRSHDDNRRALDRKQDKPETPEPGGPPKGI